MDDRPVIWDRANRKHIEKDHPERGITVAEVEEAMTDPTREEVPDPKRDGLAGERPNWCWSALLVAWVEYRSGRYPVHAHVIGRRGR